MKITQNVNIGGVAFTIDEDAFEALSTYLTQIEVRLSPIDRREVMEDVENRVAGIFAEQIGIRSQVVTLVMVQRAISIIGHADNFGEAPTTEPSGRQTSSQQAPTNDPFNGKFYRSRADNVLGGICGGLAKVLNMDVSIVRLLVVLITLFTFSALLWVYIIFWIITPLEPLTSDGK